jgi:hypothetical protein
MGLREALSHARSAGSPHAREGTKILQTLLLKVARSGEEGEKVLVILEAGVRFHATEYTRDKNTLPAPFCMKLRKHLRGKRLVDVAQLGVDRIVAFTFGAGESEHHLLLELYASVRPQQRPRPGERITAASAHAAHQAHLHGPDCHQA